MPATPVQRQAATRRGALCALGAFSGVLAPPKAAVGQPVAAVPDSFVHLAARHGDFFRASNVGNSAAPRN